MREDTSSAEWWSPSRVEARRRAISHAAEALYQTWFNDAPPIPWDKLVEVDRQRFRAGVRRGLAWVQELVEIEVANRAGV